MPDPRRVRVAAPAGHAVHDVPGAIPPGSLATYVAPRGVRVPVRVLGYRDYGPGRGPSVYLRTTGRVCARFGFPTGEEWEASCSFLVPRRGVR